jgi:hypothetical protein
MYTVHVYNEQGTELATAQYTDNQTAMIQAKYFAKYFKERGSFWFEGHGQQTVHSVTITTEDVTSEVVTA